jgi:hypothetical protein
MAFLFLLQGITSNMDMCDKMEHFAEFMEHYQVHKNYGGDSFFEYVVEELFDDQGDENHHKGAHENEAPAHSHHQCCHGSVFVAPSNSIVMKSITAEQVKQHTYYNFHFNSRFLESLFQPPRA